MKGNKSSKILLNTISSSISFTIREISWQEFESRLLVSGNVDRILVSNKNKARCYLNTFVHSLNNLIHF